MCEPCPLPLTLTLTLTLKQYLNSLDVLDVEELSFFYNSPFSRFWRSRELYQFLKNMAHFSNYFYFFVQSAYISR